MSSNADKQHKQKQKLRKEIDFLRNNSELKNNLQFNRCAREALP